MPKGATSKYQPLDVTVNGAMKMIGKKLMKKKYLEDPNPKNQLVHTINALLEAKEKLKPSTIRTGFNMACKFKES